MALPAAGQTKIEVIDGRTLVVDGTRHVLHGIAGPGARCRLRGARRDCGVLARAGLTDLTAGAAVSCRPLKSDPALSLCRAGGYDLSEGMVHAGWGEALPKAPARLKTLTAEARRRGHGMWRRPQ